MNHRVATIVALAAVLVVAVATPGRSEEPSLVPSDLYQKAWQRGAVRVLVDLNAPYVPEHRLPNAAHASAQRRNIAATQALVKSGLRGFTHRVDREFDSSLPLMAITVGDDGLRMLETLEGVVSGVREDRLSPPALLQSVPRIQGPQAWSFGYDGTGTVVVIADTGVDSSHPFLAGKVVAEACFSSSGIYGSLSLCPGGVETATGPGTAAPCDICEHGTHVAGIAAGSGASAGVSYSGVAKGAQIAAIQVFSRFNDPWICYPELSCIASFEGDQIAAQNYVLTTLRSTLNIAAVNLSLGGGTFSIPCDFDPSIPFASVSVINSLREVGIATSAAAGNDGFTNAVVAPACISSAISVGATTDPTETIWFWSDRAPGLSLLAPGVSITSSVPGGTFDTFSGTSMAAPHVTGAFAILKQAVPTASVTEMLNALQTTGLLIGGYRRIRILNALATFPGVVPTIEFQSTRYSAFEGDAFGTAAITLTRRGPADLIAAAGATVRISTVAGGTATPGTTGAADFVPLTNQLVTFNAGETSKDVVLTLRSDFTIELDETVKLALSSPTNAVLGAQRTATLTIQNDDVGGVIEFDQAGSTVNEADGTATITLRRTGGHAANATATVSTIAGGTATANVDYTAVVGKVVVFSGGADIATFTIPIINDTLAEPDETVFMKITAAGSGASVGALDQATLTIVDNDVAGTVQFGAATYQVTEGTAAATITVTRSGGAASGVTVQYRADPGSPGTATGGGVDYTLTPGTLTFGASETTKTFSLSIANDTVIEPDETVNLELLNPSFGLALGAPSTATLTIHDNDAPTFKFGAATYTVVEGATAGVAVSRTGGLGTVVTVDFQVIGGSATGGATDYTLADGTLTFPIGSAAQTISIPTTQDSLFEGSETLVIKLLNPSAGTVVAPDTTTMTITDNDSPGVIQFSAGAYSVVEGAGQATIRVTRTGTNLAGGVTVEFATTNGTATTGADYTDATQTLALAAGEASKDVVVPILDDGIAEGNETVVVMLSNPSPGATLGTIRTAVLTILDDEQGLQFSAPVYLVTEATATVTVVRTGPTVGTVTVDFESAAGTATPDTDYSNVSGTLTFGPGITTRTFTVPVINDTVFETAESVALSLSNPTGGALLGSRSTATVTIVDNDPPGALAFSAATSAVTEAAGVATIKVQRTGGAASAVTVDYATVGGGTATAGQDYLTTSGTLSFGAGVLTRTFTVPILNDNRDEPNETVNLALSNPTGGATLGALSTAVLTISDDDVPGSIAFNLAAYSVAEGGTAVITVTRSGGTAAGVTVDFTTADGAASHVLGDYTAVSLLPLTFNAGETTKTIPIPTAADVIREGNETVRLILSNPGGGATLGAINQAMLTIVDAQTGPVAQLGATALSVNENVIGGTATVKITRVGSTLAGQTVLLSTDSGGTAVDGVDYTAVTNQVVTFVASATTATAQVPILSNTNVIGNRTVNLKLTSGGPNPIPIGMPATAVLTILEDDSTLQFSSATYAVTEGGTAALTVTRTGGSIGTVTVGYATSNGSAVAPADYAAKTGTLTFGPGVMSQTISVATVNDVLIEGPETLTVTLSSPLPAVTASLGGTTTATVTINDNDAAGTLQFGSVAYRVLEGGIALLTVTRTGGSAGTVTVSYATTDGGGGGNAATGGVSPGAGIDYITKGGVLTFANGVTTQTISITTGADIALEGPETFTVTLSGPGGGAGLGGTTAAVVTITDDDTPVLRFAAASYTVAESTGSVVLTVQRVGPATTQNTVQYTFADATATGGGIDFNSNGGTLTFPPGVTTRTITVPITNDTIQESAETFTVTLVNALGGAILGTPSTSTVTIAGNDPTGTVQFSQLSYAVVEGNSATITVTRTGGTAGPVTVSYSTGDGTATAPADYTSAAGTLTFAAGETSKTFTIGTSGDLFPEGTESVALSLSGPTNGLALGNPNTATLWILDTQQSLQFGAAAYSVVEGGTLKVAVTRTGVPAGTVTVDYVLGASTATRIADFTLAPETIAGQGTLTFLPGVISQTITLASINDLSAESNESIILQLTNPTGAMIGSPSATTIIIVDNERPDLVVASLVGPAQAATGLSMSIVAAVRNQGGGASAASILGVYLSAVDNLPGAGTRIGALAIPTLAGGASFTVTANVNVPGGLSPGSYYLSALADSPLTGTGTVVEQDEGNNGLTATAQVDVISWF